MTTAEHTNLTKGDTDMNTINHQLRTIILATSLLVAPGCARFKSTITERTLPDGSVERVTVVKAGTFFDGQSALATLSSGQTDKSQKVSIGALNQESSGTNATSLVEGIVAAAVRAAVKP
jgi:hypothetical protein